MLVLSRKRSEQILIGDSIRITVVKLERGTVRLGIEAPRDVGIVRRELTLEVGPTAASDVRAPRPTASVGRK